ncbi:MAG: hypothetical protein PT118_21820 [Aphanizomenon gracile PMC644.10]|nr:hypothetical protein [Aphanizomenon gracile PMC644.10]
MQEVLPILTLFLAPFSLSIPIKSFICPGFMFIQQALHSSPAGQHYGRVHGDMNHTNHVSDCLLRLPLFPELGLSQIETVVMAINSFLERV